MHRLENLVKQISISTGTTTLALTGTPLPPYRRFVDALDDGDTTEVMVVNRITGQWQSAVYTYDSDTLTFVELIASSTGSQINFGAGVKDVYMAAQAYRQPAVSATKTGLAAAGIDQGTAVGLSGYAAVHIFETVSLGQGCVLPERPKGGSAILVNAGVNQLAVYPRPGQSIFPYDADVPVLVDFDGSASHFVYAGDGVWFRTSPPPVMVSSPLQSVDGLLGLDAAAAGAAILGSTPVLNYDISSLLTFESATLGDWSAAAFSFSGSTYSRVGNTVKLSVKCSGTPSFTTGSGNLLIKGFPFNAVSDVETISLRDVTGFGTWPTGALDAYGRFSNAQITLRCNRINTTAANFTTAAITTGVALSFRLTGTILVQ
jgi:hypothetical protein